MNLFKAIGFKLISALLFAAMSALVRQLSDVAPVGQLVFFRSACAIPPVLLIYALRGELMSAVRTKRPFGQVGRGLLSVAGMFTNFSALTRLPLADATAISFASFKTAGNVPPVSPARRARFSAGKSASRGVAHPRYRTFPPSTGARALGPRSGNVTASAL